MLTGTTVGISQTLGWTGAEGVRGWLLLPPVGWGLVPKAPFQRLQPAGRRLELPAAARACQDYQGARVGAWRLRLAGHTGLLQASRRTNPFTWSPGKCQPG